MGNDIWEKQENSAYWKPSIGDELIGELLGSEDGKYGTNYRIKRQSDGEVITLGTWKVLLSRLANAENGDIVKIVYVKDELPTVRGNKPTKMFDVFIKKA